MKRDSQFKLSYFLSANEVFHIARVNITSSQDLSLHTHDYAEILWIEKGTGYHHVNGRQVRLSAGDMVMIRPRDCHTFSATGRGITLVNIAFPTETIDFCAAAISGTATSISGAPRCCLSISNSRRISSKDSPSRAEEAMKYRRSRLQLDSLLLFIFRTITANQEVEDNSEIPLWLFNAIQKYNSPEHFARGVAGFVDLCDRNIDHVNRIVRIHFYKTLTELVNEFRMRYAITQLAITNMPIKQICSNCGFRNLGHFYKTFRAVYHQTPREYRKLNQMIV